MSNKVIMEVKTPNGNMRLYDTNGVMKAMADGTLPPDYHTRRSFWYSRQLSLQRKMAKAFTANSPTGRNYRDGRFSERVLPYQFRLQL